jgi:DNA-binding transcriptional LysR family regulator
METISTRIDRMLCFAAVAERGSFTAAAAALGYSKAHISRQVAELERELGAELLLRTTRRLSLTPLGHRYAEQAARLRTTFDEAQQLIAAERSDVRGLLRITTATTFGEVFLVDLIGDFQTQYPQVEVEIDMSIQPRDLLDGHYDFAFRITRTIEERFVARAVGLIREIPVAGPALLARHGTPRRPSDLAPLPALRNLHFRDDPEWVFVRGRDSETVRVRSPLAINNFSAILHAAELGIGIARLPHYLVHDALREGRLQRLLPDWEIAQLPMYLVHPQRRHPTRLQSVFRAFAIAWFEAPERQALLR